MHEYLKKAEESFDNDNFKAAIEYCDKLIDEGLELKEAYSLKAHSECYLSKNKDDKLLTDALKNIDYAIENNPDDDWSFFIKAFIFSRMKKYEEALVEINKAIHFHQHYYYYDMRGKINNSLYREKEALNDYSISIGMKEDTSNYNNRGELYLNMDEFQLARQDFQRAVELDDTNAEAWLNLGKALNRLDLYETSISAYNTAIKLEPDNDFSYFLISIPLKYLKNYKESLKNLNKAIEMDPEYSDYYRKRGNLYFDWAEENTNSGNTDLDTEFAFYANQKKTESQIFLAERDFKKAIELDDENILAYRALLKLYNYQDNYKKQAEVLEKLEKADPDDKSVFAERGYAEMELGNDERAIFYFDKYLEYEPDSAEAYSNRGICYEHLERYGEAMADCNKAVELLPCEITYVNRGTVKVSWLGDKAAIEDYNEAIKLFPDSNLAYFDRGISKYNLKRYEEAVNDYITAVENAQKTNIKIDAEQYIEKFYDSLKGLFEEQNYKKIITFCNKITCLGFKHEKIYNLKGAAEIMLGKLNEALRDCKKANKINPEFEPAKTNLRIIQEKMKKSE